jgi:stearoyl-CoA desaturase (delta-9 desaturase)
VLAFAAGIGAFLIGGAYGLVWGFFVPLTLLYHGTYTVNSICHIFGRQRYATGDDSRNNPLIAVITLGEGWHNNHHHYQRSTAQGFYWWEIDVTYYVLRGLQAIGLVWGVTRPPLHVRDER